MERAARVPEQWHTGGHVTPLPYNAVVARLPVGDPSHVERANAILAEIDDVLSDVTTPAWMPSVCGAYPIVPEYLAGMPDCMRMAQAQPVESSPVGLWVDVVSSAGVPLHELRNRGIAVLALALKLQQFKPVTLHVVVGTEFQGSICMDMETTPFDISVAANFLCNGETARLPMYAILREHVQSPLGSLVRPDMNLLRKRFSVPTEDIFLTGTHLNDFEIRTNPVQWVKRMVAQFVVGGVE